jgi:hypothetical protein
MKNANGFSGCGLFLLWTLFLVFFWTLVQSVFGFSTEVDLGYPVWLLLARIVTVLTFIISLLGLLGRRRWAVISFFASAVAMIPLSVAYSYFQLQLAEGLALTTSWIVRNTLITAIAIMLLVTIVFWSMRSPDKG